jgi:hypothetical protein
MGIEAPQRTRAMPMINPYNGDRRRQCAPTVTFATLIQISVGRNFWASQAER